MGQLHISIPGFARSDFFRLRKDSSHDQGFKAHFPTEKASQPAAPDRQTSAAKTIAKRASETQCKSIELRIIQDGKIYRSKAEEERLVALGQWHHRRVRRRERMRR